MGLLYCAKFSAQPLTRSDVSTRHSRVGDGGDSIQNRQGQLLQRRLASSHPSCDWNVGKICGSPGEKLSDDDRNTELTITAETGRKNKTKEINHTARNCLVEDHHFIRQLSVGNSGRFVYRINPATNMSIGVGAVTKDVI